MGYSLRVKVVLEMLAVECIGSESEFERSEVYYSNMAFEVVDEVFSVFKPSYGHDNVSNT